MFFKINRLSDILGQLICLYSQCTRPPVFSSNSQVKHQILQLEVLTFLRASDQVTKSLHPVTRASNAVIYLISVALAVFFCRNFVK